MKWKLIGTASGTNPILADYKKYQEIHVVVEAPLSGTIRQANIEILPVTLDKNSRTITSSGSGSTEAISICCHLTGSESSINCNIFSFAQNDITSSSTTKIYGR